jgi:hypothetical protein
MWRLSETIDKKLLQEMSDIIKEIYTNENNVLNKLKGITLSETPASMLSFNDIINYIEISGG